MKNKDTVFPQYRKLVNNRTFYKILDDRNFEEIQLLGSKKMRYVTHAVQYPEILKISDLLDLTDGHYLLSSQDEWEEIDDNSFPSLRRD